MNSEWITAEEKELVQKCIKGDPFYEKQLYVKYISAMYNRTVRMIGNEEIAKDVVQDSFIEIFKSLSNFRGESTLGAWIKKIVIYTCLNYLKNNTKKTVMPLGKYLDDSLICTNDTDEEYDIKLIHQGIKKLPDGCRNVINLYLIEGYSHKEIAGIMKISESTSKTQYLRAKSLLKAHIKEIKNG